MKRKAPPFCILDKTDKTFDLVLKYYELISKHVLDTTHLDNVIQANECKDHLCRHNKLHDPEETSRWFDENANGLRSYLNTVKNIAFLMYIDNTINYRDKVVKELYYKFADLYNENKSLFDTIRINVEK
jgi:hypothetical protein